MEKIPVVSGPKTTIKLANGSTTKTEGEASYDIQIGQEISTPGINRTRRMLIIDINSPIILGADFLIEEKCILDMGNGYITIDEMSCRLLKTILKQPKLHLTHKLSSYRTHYIDSYTPSGRET